MSVCVCVPPVFFRSSLVLTMRHSPSMGVFNRLLIKRICILFVVFPRLRTANKFPAGIAFAAFPCSFMRLWWLAYSLPAGSAERSVFFVLGLRNRQQGRVSVSSFQLRFGIFPVVLWYNMKVGVAAMLKDWLWPKGVWVVRLIPCWESLGSRSERIASQARWLLVALGSSQVWKLTKSWFLQEMLGKSCLRENRLLSGEESTLDTSACESPAQWTDHLLFVVM